MDGARLAEHELRDLGVEAHPALGDHLVAALHGAEYLLLMMILSFN